MLQTQVHEYQDQGVTLKGYCAFDKSITGKRPAVLVCHDWSGQNNFARQKADLLAEMGYVGFAVDMYGEGKTGETKEEKIALMHPLVENRTTLLLSRITAGLKAAQSLPFVDSSKIAAIGFCFGGLSILDLARSGADIKAAISFHGLLNPPSTPNKAIKADILALHGYDDPMADHQALIDFANEMTRSKAQFEINIYGHTMHAFTNPEANDPGFGTVYSKMAASRSWQAMATRLKEVFA